MAEATITQQLVGNMHPDLIDRHDMSPMRKLPRAVQGRSRGMEKHYTKQQILEAYLNQVDLSATTGSALRQRLVITSGISSAQLSLAQAASLAALPKAPPAYDPIRHPEANKTRRNVILDLMGGAKAHHSRCRGRKSKARGDHHGAEQKDWPPRPTILSMRTVRSEA